MFRFVPYFAALRNRNVTIWARVQALTGAKAVLDTPEVTPALTAHCTAGA